MNSTQDPYRAPTSTVGEMSRGAQGYETASRLRRFFTYFIDVIGFYLLLLPVFIVMMLVGGQKMLENQGLTFVVSMLVLFGYYVFFEGLFSRTPGKWICGTIVVDESGRPPSFNQVLGRTAARLIPFEPFSLLFSPETDRKGWHDSLAKTRVVMARSLA